MKEIELKILSYLKKRLDSARFKHTLGTRRIVEELARKYGVSREKAVIAALLHDAGKGYSKKEMVRYAAKHKVKVPEIKSVLKYNPSLLHSYISADIARRMFKVSDREILSAIAEHTVGAPAMSTLSRMMYVADSVSFDRRYPGVKELRRLAYRDSGAATMAAMANKLYYVVKKRKWLNPGALAAWNYMVNEIAHRPMRAKDKVQ